MTTSAMNATSIYVWYVKGDPDNVLWQSKEDAERWARNLFPGESPDKRYARIFFRNVHTYES